MNRLKPFKLNNFKMKTASPSFFSDWQRLRPRYTQAGTRKPLSVTGVQKRLNQMKISQNKPRNANQTIQPIKPIKPLTIRKPSY